MRGNFQIIGLFLLSLDCGNARQPAEEDGLQRDHCVSVTMKRDSQLVRGEMEERITEL